MRHRERLFDVWTGQRSVARDVRINDALDAAIRHNPRELNGHHARRPLPTARHHMTITRIDAYTDLRRKPVHKLPQMRGRLRRDRSQHDALNSQVAEMLHLFT